MKMFTFAGAIKTQATRIMNKEQLVKTLDSQRIFFENNFSKAIDYRIYQLQALKYSIQIHEEEICKALHDDLHKSAEEAFLTEISIVQEELVYHIKHLKSWSKAKRARTPFKLTPSKSYVIAEPYGVVLIMAPWNYPFQLIMNPLIGAVAAGNCAILKTSPTAPATSKVVAKIIEDVFDHRHVTTIEGHREMNTLLLEQKFDYIFFTGSPALGRVVMESAARHLTPVTLELGGKSPCIIDKNANLDVAVKRAIWGKLINAGQTCIAPDYFFVHVEIKDEFVRLAKQYIKQFYGEQPEKSPYYPRMVSEEAFDRVSRLLKDGKVVYGGETDRSSKYIAPTILDHIMPSSPVMQEEIFGPLIPIMTYRQLTEVVEFINSRPKPLALYFFGDKNKGRQIASSTSSGGVCINDTLLHVANHHIPFGGVGNSGMGQYHGKKSFDTFTHYKSLLISPTWFDLALKYVPFNGLHWFKRLL